MPTKMWVVACVDNLQAEDMDGQIGYVVPVERNRDVFRITFVEHDADRIAQKMAAKNPGLEVQVLECTHGFHCKAPPAPVKKVWVGGEYIPETV